MGGIICHYTNAEGLLGIVANKVFWASKSTFTNDPSEIRFAAELIEELVNRRSLKPAFKDALSGETGAIMAYDDIYVLSFSKNPDVLSMWNRYSKGGGYSLCFDSQMMEDQISAKYAEILRGRFEVIYDREAQENELSADLEILITEYNQGNFLLGKVPNTKISNAVLRMLFMPKHECYGDEQEVRYIFTIPNQLGSSSNMFKDWTQFRTRSGEIVPYIEIKFDPTNILKKVYLSPGSSKRQGEGVDLFLRKHLGGIGVYTSTLPYLEL